MNYSKKWSCSIIQKNGIRKSNPNLNDSAAMFGYEKSGTVAINDFLKNEKNQSKCVLFLWQSKFSSIDHYKNDDEEEMAP